MSPNLLSATQTAVAAVWADVLGRAGPIGSEDDFFNLGGDSFAMMTMMFRINDLFQLDLPPGTVMENPTLGALTEVVHQSCAITPNAVPVGAAPGERASVLDEGTV
jgi:acyl carrier protein